MAGQTAKKSKRFRIAVEGATTDGRVISREWIEQMAKNYSPTVYGARVNMEHIKGYAADSTFRRFGDVTQLQAEEISEGQLAGKLALYGWIDPTQDLVELTKSRQKIYTSIEVNPKFADTGEAYLVGLAVTDDPASLGTEYLSFSATAKANPLASRKLDADNLFTAAEETVIEFEDVIEKPALFSRIKELFTKKSASDDVRFSDVHQAVELVAQECQGISETVSSMSGKHDDTTQKLEALSKDFNELKTQLATQDNRSERRPFSTGGNDSAEELTNC